MPIKTKAGADLYFQERGVWPKGWEPPEEPKLTERERTLKRVYGFGGGTPADSISLGLKPRATAKEAGISGLLGKDLITPPQSDSLRAGLGLAKPKSPLDILKLEGETHEEEKKAEERRAVSPKQAIAAGQAEKAKKQYDADYKEIRSISGDLARIESAELKPEYYENKEYLEKELGIDTSDKKAIENYKKVLRDDRDRLLNETKIYEVTKQYPPLKYKEGSITRDEETKIPYIIQNGKWIKLERD